MSEYFDRIYFRPVDTASFLEDWDDELYEKDPENTGIAEIYYAADIDDRVDLFLWCSPEVYEEVFAERKEDIDDLVFRQTKNGAVYHTDPELKDSIIIGEYEVSEEEPEKAVWVANINAGEKYIYVEKPDSKPNGDEENETSENDV